VLRLRKDVKQESHSKKHDDKVTTWGHQVATCHVLVLEHGPVTISILYIVFCHKVRHLQAAGMYQRKNMSLAHDTSPQVSTNCCTWDPVPRPCQSGCTTSLVSCMIFFPSPPAPVGPT